MLAFALWSAYVVAWATLSESATSIAVLWWLAGLALIQAIGQSLPGRLGGERPRPGALPHDRAEHLSGGEIDDRGSSRGEPGGDLAQHGDHLDVLVMEMLEHRPLDADGLVVP